MIFLRNISLLNFNTFHLQSKAKYWFEVQQISDLNKVVATDCFKNHPHLVLGGGSNVLLTQDFDGLILKINLKGKKIVQEDADSVWIECQSGENWHEVVTHCVDNHWGGIENLALIPGCIGAAPIQNIGAYGVEIKDVLESVSFFHFEQHAIQIFNAADCNFGYRDSIFKGALKGKGVVVAVVLKLEKKPKINSEYGDIQKTLAANQVENPTIQDVYQAVIQIRLSKLPNPAEIGNAGSFFKNPELPIEVAQKILENYPNAPHYVVDEKTIKIPAGWMIEQCGWKGYREGPIGVHDKQALVLVNTGGGNGKDIEALAYKIQASVKAKFGVMLEMEVNVV
jgi:UDP-N-acetylmuramate dehydrogenase